jgi:DNA-binding transcriptional ArsR family regulator
VPKSATSSKPSPAAPASASAVDKRIVKALSHPLRTRILQLLSDRVASPNEMARALGEPLGNVSYHVRILLQHECIELVRTQPRRGALEHFYRPLVRPMLGDLEWQALSPELRNELTGRTLVDLFTDAGAAAAKAGFENEHAHIIRMLFELDEQGFKEMSALVARTLDDAMRIQEESVNRRAEGTSAGDEAAGEIGLLLFERA